MSGAEGAANNGRSSRGIRLFALVSLVALGACSSDPPPAEKKADAPAVAAESFLRDPSAPAPAAGSAEAYHNALERISRRAEERSVASIGTTVPTSGTRVGGYDRAGGDDEQIMDTPGVR